MPFQVHTTAERDLTTATTSLQDLQRASSWPTPAAPLPSLLTVPPAARPVEPPREKSSSSSQIPLLPSQASGGGDIGSGRKRARQLQGFMDQLPQAPGEKVCAYL